MTPKYEQLVQELRAALPQWYADGQRKLPGEQALAAQLSVSRQTLRQALAVLEQEGLIEKRRGSGSFLCPAAARQDRRIAVIATSQVFAFLRQLLEPLLAAGDRHDLRALAAKQLRRGAPDPGGSAGHDADFTI